MVGIFAYHHERQDALERIQTILGYMVGNNFAHHE